MQRDLNTVRQLLRALESAPAQADQSVILRDQPPATISQLLYHLALLQEAGLVTGQPFGGPGQRNPLWLDLGLTWAGHDFLDAVRDPDIWRHTQRALARAGGFTFALVKALAQGLLKQQLEEHSGVKLEL